jgi:hypothetical protein
VATTSDLDRRHRRQSAACLVLATLLLRAVRAGGSPSTPRSLAPRRYLEPSPVQHLRHRVSPPQSHLALHLPPRPVMDQDTRDATPTRLPHARSVSSLVASTRTRTPAARLPARSSGTHTLVPSTASSATVVASSPMELWQRKQTATSRVRETRPPCAVATTVCRYTPQGLPLRPHPDLVPSLALSRAPSPRRFHLRSPPAPHPQPPRVTDRATRAVTPTRPHPAHWVSSQVASTRTPIRSAKLHARPSDTRTPVPSTGSSATVGMSLPMVLSRLRLIVTSRVMEIPAPCVEVIIGCRCTLPDPSPRRLLQASLLRAPCPRRPLSPRLRLAQYLPALPRLPRPAMD